VLTLCAMAHGLIDILLVLLAAKLGAEVAERIGVPAVIGEIVAGLVLGPSLLGWVEVTEPLALLAELGVIILLLQVGLEMDLGEMARVGTASLGVAVVGVVIPFALGYGAAVAFGEDGTTAMFLGAALTATSVGITARAFGDLRILSSTESRIVLGAAVADDVLGLVILTVVVRIVEQGSFDALVAVEVLGVALAFLVITTYLGLRLAPPGFRWLQRNTLGTSTVLVAAIVLTLALAELAIRAELAPIIGAFVAGLALGRTRQAERIERDLTPLAAVFIPIFFVQVGLQVDVQAMIRPSVLGLAGVLLVVAIVGKVVAGLAVGRAPVDRLLIGIGMIPRGEVGLIFATIGLADGVLDDDLYAALLLVVLVTTIITPGLIRARLARSTRTERAATTDEMPDGGWLEIGDGTVQLTARPGAGPALGVALEVARLSGRHEPDASVVSWMSDAAEEGMTWGPAAVRSFAELLRSGSRRSWRLLDATGVLAAALPDLADQIDHRRRDATLLDPAHLLRWPTVEALVDLLGPDGDESARREAALTADPDVLPLAALALDLAGAHGEPAAAAADLARDLGLAPATSADVVAAATDAELLRSAATHMVGLDTAVTPELVAHIGSVDRARRSYVLGLAVGPLDRAHREALDELYAGLVGELGRTDRDSTEDLIEGLRARARELAPDARTRARLDRTPGALLVSESPDDLVGGLALLSDGVPPVGQFRVTSGPGPLPDTWQVWVAGRDAPGLLSRITRGFNVQGLSIQSAAVAAYSDRAVLDVFRVCGSGPPDPDRLEDDVLDAFRQPLELRHVVGAVANVDQHASSWSTVCTVRAPDRPGLLADLTSTLASLGFVVHSARIGTRGGLAVDRFDLTDARGRKLNDAAADALRAALEGD
jgi:Kef-type K+ transport system membrane component KefB